MARQQMEERPQKRKKKVKIEFDASMVFDIKKDDDVKLDLDSLNYTAQKGQGGDRRA